MRVSVNARKRTSTTAKLFA
jgi:enamine deaminase RidA (YjgF/YER057c/UK114 family)